MNRDQPIVRRGPALLAAGLLTLALSAGAAVTELNPNGGTSAANGLHIYLESTSKIQVRRLNNTGQVYSPTVTPASNNLDNGIFLRANGTVYGPSHTVGGTFSPTAYNTQTISAASPAGNITDGTTQTATGTYGITNGPQLSVVYTYLRPFDFVTLSVTLTIPAGYPVAANNPVRYYHAVDTYLGGSDNGCGVTFTDSNGHRVVGTYPPASGTTCPSSTAIPAGVSIIESFRERGGLPFSRYCTALWSDFWDTSNPFKACAVSNPTQLPNTVTTTYQDTGMAIEYDFTAPGTYTFDYDFVIGSPAVPPYDHLELRYDPGSNLCPFNITVLGCLSSTVPCPSGSEVNASFTGNVTASGGSTTLTPASGAFSIAAGTPTASVTAQVGTVSASVTLGANNLSAVPFNGVKCWNGSSATCTFTAPASSCFAADLDACSNLTGSPARCGATGNRLYTKVAGQGFNFDLVALKGSPKTVDTAFTGTVSVDLVSSTGTATGSNKCPTTSPATVAGVSAQNISFSAGRPATATTYAVLAGQNTQAGRNVWVRFTQGSGPSATTVCSSDRFAIRPAALTVTSTDATADASGASATALPRLAAGANFNLTAASGTPGYDGTPTISAAPINATPIEWLAAPAGVGTLGGSFTAAAPLDGTASGTFTYSEVGYFRFQARGVADATYTAAYQDGSDTVCQKNAAGADAFANTANAAGKVGCLFGNTAATNHFGRFFPDHFDVAVTEGCAAGTFTYSGQPFGATVTARNAAGGATANYQGASYARATTLTARNAGDTAANPGAGALAGEAIGAAAFTGGVATITAATVPALTYTVPTATTPTVVRLRATENAPGGDGVTSLRAPPAATVEGTTTVRSGRLAIGNAYGSEFIALPVRSETQFWTATGWQRNVNDSCTALTVPTSANAGLTFATQTPSNQLAAGETAAAFGVVADAFGRAPVVAGNAGLRFSAPGAGNFGYVDVVGNIVRGANTWLLLATPTSRVCFGSCGPRNSIIYSQERF